MRDAVLTGDYYDRGTGFVTNTHNREFLTCGQKVASVVVAVARFEEMTTTHLSTFEFQLSLLEVTLCINSSQKGAGRHNCCGLTMDRLIAFDGVVHQLMKSCDINVALPVI